MCDVLHSRDQSCWCFLTEVNYPTLLAHRLHGSLLEGRASCFHDALCRYGCIYRECSLHRRFSECPAPTSSRPRERMFHAAFASLSASNPQAGQKCSRTHNGFSVETPHAAHSLVVPLGLTATKCVPSRSTTPCFSAWSSSIVDGKKVVSRFTIRDEEASWCTLAASSLLSKRYLDKPLLSSDFTIS